VESKHKLIKLLPKTSNVFYQVKMIPILIALSIEIKSIDLYLRSV